LHILNLSQLNRWIRIEPGAKPAAQATARRQFPARRQFLARRRRPVALATIAACLGPRGLEEPLESPESLDDPECLECLEILEPRREFAPKLRYRLVPHALKGPQGNPGLPDLQVTLDPPAPQDNQARTHQQVPRGHKVPRALQVRLDPMARLGSLGLRPQVPKLNLATQDRREILVPKDLLDNLANPDNLELAELLEKKAHPDQLDSLVDLETQAHPDLQVPLVAKGSVEFVRNIARWTAGYFSKTEREGKKKANGKSNGKSNGKRLFR